MRIDRLAAALLAAVFATGASAQSPMDRAARAAEDAAGMTGTFSDGTVSDVVAPFETARPPEAGMNHSTFGDRILGIRDADTDQGRALRATEDSAAIRPEADLDGQGALFNDANWAHENARAIAGKYFSGRTGTCETPDLPVSAIRDEFCESLPAREAKTCRLVRKIWVDRTDTYRCDKRAARFVKVCGRRNSYVCKVNTNKRSCIQENVQLTGGAVSWRGHVATISFPAPTAVAGQESFAALVKHGFGIRISDRFLPSEIRLTHVEAQGVLQVTDRSRSNIFGTFAGNTWHGFGGNGAGCPANDRSGLLMPVTKITGCDWFTPEYPWAAIAPRPLTAQSNYLESNLAHPGYENGWDLPQGISSWLPGRLRWKEECDDRGCGIKRRSCVAAEHNSCFQYAQLSLNPAVSRDVLRFLPVNTFAAADPEGRRRFKETRFTARVVYTNGAPGAGSARLSIRFDGACCDSFENTGREQCE